MMFLLKHGFISILQCIRVVNRTWKRGLNPVSRKTMSLAELGNSTSESMPAHAAERMITALCCAPGYTVRKNPQRVRTGGGDTS